MDWCICSRRGPFWHFSGAAARKLPTPEMCLQRQCQGLRSRRAVQPTAETCYAFPRAVGDWKRMLARFREFVGWRRLGGSLIRRYVAVFLVVVSVVLLTNSVLEIGFFHRDYKSVLIRAQREQAEAAAAEI